MAGGNYCYTGNCIIAVAIACRESTSIARGDTKILGIAVSKNGYLTRQRLVSIEKLEILTFPHHDFLELQTCDTAGSSSTLQTHEIQ